MAGKALAAGFRGAWTELRGDWKYLVETLYIQDHYANDDHICHLCNVRKIYGEYPYTDFSRTAGQRRTHVSNEEWVARANTLAHICPLIFIIGFSILRCVFDCMHTLDLGILQVAIPSCLRDLAAEAVWRGGRSLAAQLTAAYVSYRAWCQRSKVPCAARQKFKPTVWMKSGYPRISQVTAKAAALRSMLYWVSEECDKHVVTEHQQMRAA